MKPHLVGLLRARTAAVYLLSLHACAHAVLAFEPLPWPVLAGGAAALAAALLLGVWWGPWLGSLVDRGGRTRLILVSWIPYGGLLALAAMAVMSDRAAHDMGGVGVVFVLLQPAFLLFAGVGRGYIGAIQNALVMTVFASLPGGVVAATAVCGFVAWTGAFLVFDNFARKLAAYPSGGGGGVGAATGELLFVVAPIVIAMAAYFAVWPAAPYVKLERSAAKRKVTREQIAAAYRDLALTMAVGGLMAYFVAYALMRMRGGGSAPILEVVEARRRGEEVVATAPRRLGEGDYAGLRGRIVRAYVRFVERCAKLGILRRPDMTPVEFAGRVGVDVGALTESFMRARWGPDEPVEDDARAAERAADAAVEALRARG